MFTSLQLIMYAKLFSRITESSLMEEPIAVRYTFVMMLAISDPTGHVIGTDIAIARRLNMPIEEFESCIAELQKPDEDSNSSEEEGRRIIPSTGERGYRVVNYLTYRDTKDQEHRREYMREYMRKKRGSAVAVNTPVARVNRRKQKLTHAESEEKADAEALLLEKEAKDVVTQKTDEPDLFGACKAKASLEDWLAFAATLTPKFPPLEAEQAWNYYESNGWKVGKNPAKDWRACCRTCHLRWQKDAAPSAQPKAPCVNRWEQPK